eukprot:8917341-Pyramimonas_sp.AAC.1
MPVAPWAMDIHQQVDDFNCKINRLTAELFADDRFSPRKPYIKTGTMALIRLRRYIRRAQQAVFRHSWEPIFLLARLLPRQLDTFTCASRGPDESSQCPWEGPMRQLAMACG